MFDIYVHPNPGLPPKLWSADQSGNLFFGSINKKQSHQKKAANYRSQTVGKKQGEGYMYVDQVDVAMFGAALDALKEAWEFGTRPTDPVLLNIVSRTHSVLRTQAANLGRLQQASSSNGGNIPQQSPISQSQVPPSPSNAAPKRQQPKSKKISTVKVDSVWDF